MREAEVVALDLAREASLKMAESERSGVLRGEVVSPLELNVGLAEVHTSETSGFC